MAAVTPIPAASIILLRDEPFEILMIRRHEKSSFAPDVWAFPGGVMEESDRNAGRGILLNAMRIAAARELFEETGISLGSPVDLERLVWTGRWITPEGLPKRFDTYFFLACVGRDTVTTLQETEAVDSIWISPAEAVQRHMAGSFPLVFPTLKNLEAIVGFRSASELIETRRKAEIPTTRPILVVENGQKKIVLP
ncbi:MAG TPA: NUDIX hydrolase [Thermoanaerobaculia bacterium]